MIKGRRLPFQCAVNEKLLSGRKKQISATHNFTDPHRGIVHHDRKLVRWNTIPAPDDKITEVAPRDKLLEPFVSIVS